MKSRRGMQIKYDNSTVHSNNIMTRLIAPTTRDRHSNIPITSNDSHEEEKRGENQRPENSILRRTRKSRPSSSFPWQILPVISFFLLVPLTNGEGNNWERPLNMPRIQGLEVMCGQQHMEVHLSFDLPFHGLVASKGMYGHPNCIYVPPRSGNTKFVFNINYDSCGTKPDNHGKFYENTIVVQYDEELIEAWDEAKRLRCEWFNDYEKTATKTSPMVISDLEIVELNFHGDNVDCWMEIQEGRGPWAPPLNGIVPLGSTLTMVIAVKDPTGEFDMRVKACEASDGHNGHILPLSDADGCILRPKLIGKFAKVKVDDNRATVLTYAFLSAFKFPDMLNVHMRCTVEICRHGCPEHCAPAHLASASNPKQNEIAGQHSLHEPIAYESQQKTVKAQINNEIPRATPKALVVNENGGQPHGNDEPAQASPVPSDILDNIREHIKQQGIQDQIQNQNQIPHLTSQQLQQQHHQQQQQHQQQLQQQQPQPPPPPHGQPPPQLFSPPPSNLPPMSPHMFPPGPVRTGPPPPPGRPGPYFPPNQQRPHPHRYPPHPGNFPPPGRPPLRNGPHPGPPRPQNGPPIMHGHGFPPQHQIIHHRKDTGETLPENIALPRLGEAAADDNSGEYPRDLDENRGRPQEHEEANAPQAQPLKGDPSSSPQDSEMPTGEITATAFPKGPRKLRLRRSILSNNGVIGIEGAFKVVSEADLNFALNSTSNSPSSTVLKGSRMIRRDTIYGICLPRFGFGIVFFGLGLATLVAILIAIFLAYAHYIIKSSSMKTVENCQASPVHPYAMHENVLPIPMVILRKMW